MHKATLDLMKSLFGLPTTTIAAAISLGITQYGRTFFTLLRDEQATDSEKRLDQRSRGRHFLIENCMPPSGVAHEFNLSTHSL